MFITSQWLKKNVRMEYLSPDEISQKWAELQENGFTSVAGVLDKEFVEELKQWSKAIIKENPPDEEFAYQGSDIHIFTEERWSRRVHLKLGPTRMPDPMAAKIIFNQKKLAICKELGFEGLTPQEWVILISKPPRSPPCYWHQDYMNWNSPEAFTPWPTKLLIGFYLSDTKKENGCMRVISGSHQNHHQLHDKVPPPHEEEIKKITDLNHPTYAPHPDAVDVNVAAGDMILVDARLLHGTWGNSSQLPRTLFVIWHDVFSKAAPSWWRDSLPKEMEGFDRLIEYEKTKIPTRFVSNPLQ
jgi:ectoine hydroxylase-related dioxygenase (phytanoyl-CoA dioxygenase family)|tara:strand:- start:93 stop:989 length:897 start_codon:yes stop_codon:yes gene_type:complete